MAYLQEDPNDAPGVAGKGQGSAGSSGGAFIGGGGQGATTTNGSPGATPTSPAGGYTNLLSYLGANQGSGATTGEAAENVVQQSANDAGAKQTDYSGAANNDLSSATKAVSTDPAVLDKIKNGGAGVDQSVLDKIKGGIATVDPTALSQLQTGATKDRPDTTYRGPDAAAVTVTGAAHTPDVAWAGPNQVGGDGWSGATQAAGAAAEGANGVVAGNAKNAQGGQSGVSGLLKTAYQSPSYTQGENTLDAFLAGGTSGGQAALGKAAGVASGVKSNYEGINAALQKGIGAGKDTATSTNKAYKGAQDVADATTAATNKTYADALAAAQADTTAKNAYQVASAGQFGGLGSSGPGGDAGVKAFTASDGSDVAQGPVAQSAPNAATPGKVSIDTSGQGNGVINVGGTPQYTNVGAPDNPNTGYGNVALQFAHGGEVPSYSQLLNFLNEKKKK